ncbi:DUF6179 domain-containing protein [Inconstantimicrobium mannanitabidum]|uniref:Uncharacterized protein n=1 Tax=Inconstantimicrobium mannanitabidum TaxID=1604901 RepID=A0ACB5RDM1_9CLOT|nr:DUF6179 domain-containing protein [Clostridium sp. TW13]GKX67138.1 hypothetical protein rsdtw13_23960 [Clostridium sp. TW13]
MNLSDKNNLLETNKSEVNLKAVNKNQYLISIINEGRKSRLISEEEIFNIQLKLTELLKELILRYTKGESTSVTVETTENLLNSILYAIDFHLLELNSVKAAIGELKQKELKHIYEAGIEQIRICVIETRKLYKKINKNRLQLDLESYNITLDEGIPYFFEKYNIIFENHYALASIDYPLVFDDMKVRGVSYIKNYLEHLDIETEFCRFFLIENIKKLLIGYEKMCRLNHNIELINIFEIVINNSIFSVLSGNKAAELFINKNQFKFLEEKLGVNNKKAIYSFINIAVQTVIDELKIINPFLLDYIDKYKEQLKKRVINVVDNNCLRSIMVVEEEEVQKFNFTFDEGKRMSEQDFNLIISKIIEKSDVKDKVEIIKTQVYSLQDFIDILNSDCLFGEEYKFIFETLGEIELTIIVKLVFYEELRDGEANLSEIIESKKEMEFEWQEYFIQFIDSLNKQRKDIIAGLLNEVDYEEIKFY